jgi:hypothetical protein
MVAMAVEPSARRTQGRYYAATRIARQAVSGRPATGQVGQVFIRVAQLSQE